MYNSHRPKGDGSSSRSRHGASRGGQHRFHARPAGERSASRGHGGVASHGHSHTASRGHSSASSHGQERTASHGHRGGYSRGHGSDSSRGGRGGYSGGGRPQHRSGSYSSHGSHGGNRRSGGRGRNMPTFDPSKFINTNPVESTPDVYTPQHTFSTFGLNDRLASTLASIDRVTPTPIQDQVIPEILNGHDVIGLAETGTGKTAAFLLPLIHKTLSDRYHQTLILAPTRELAIQIQEELRTLTPGMQISSVIVVGGMNINPQIRALRNHNHFIIGTPGRMLDLLGRRVLKTAGVKAVVLDEADRMFDMGFIRDIREILAAAPSERTTLCFSATMPKEVVSLVHDCMQKPVTISVKKKDVTNSIEQNVVRYEHHEKFETLCTLLADQDFRRVIIFGSMKHSVEKLAQQLTAHGIGAESIHGNKSHSQRQNALKRFKSGNARVLVATDVAARGIHVDNVSHVINYDLPNTFEDYVHRIGRTGRGAKRGKALTFVEN
jgi:ATP-dependent RNA helicase RhlE